MPAHTSASDASSILNRTRELATPDAAEEPKTLTMHGHDREDPYFWMRLSDEQKNSENPDAHTRKVLAYLDAENTYKDEALGGTADFQQSLFEEIVGRIKKDDASVPYLKNGYWYYTRYEKGREYPIHCRKRGSLEADEEVILDANERAEGHDYYSASGLSVSPDNRWLAFGEDTVSRRVYTIRFKNLETGEISQGALENTTGGGAWADDSEHYFYTSKNQETLLSEKIWRHRRGGDEAKDHLVYEEKDPSYYIGVYRSKSQKFVIIYASSTLSSDYWTLPSSTPRAEFSQFSSREDEHEYHIEHYDDAFFVVSNWDAQNFRLMKTPDTSTEKKAWKEVIAHREDVLLSDIDIFKEHLVVSERKDALTHLRVIHQGSGKEHYVDFGEEVYVAYASTNPEFDTNTLRFAYGSLTTPMSTYDYDLDGRGKELKKREEVVGGHDPKDYVAQRIFVTARDGVRVPVSLVRRRDTELGADTPLLLYAYGSYGHTVDPWFSSSRLSLLDRGFAFAIAHIRGGQAMGRAWYDAGKTEHKQNTFNDFEDCARYLVDKNFTSAAHLYAMGGSAGGLLMGAVINQAPELFQGVIAAVPFVDVVSTMLDETIPLTTNEFDEWGNPKEKRWYDVMLAYSPYDQVKAQDYPNLLVTTGLHDSQVQYWEPAKWVARLRDRATGDGVILMHTNMEAGHGGASGRFRRHKETAMEYAFLLDLEGKTGTKPAR